MDRRHTAMARDSVPYHAFKSNAQGYLHWIRELDQGANNGIINVEDQFRCCTCDGIKHISTMTACEYLGCHHSVCFQCADDLCLPGWHFCGPACSACSRDSISGNSELACVSGSGRDREVSPCPGRYISSAIITDTAMHTLAAQRAIGTACSCCGARTTTRDRRICEVPGCLHDSCCATTQCYLSEQMRFIHGSWLAASDFYGQPQHRAEFYQFCDRVTVCPCHEEDLVLTFEQIVEQHAGGTDGGDAVGQTRQGASAALSAGTSDETTQTEYPERPV